MKEIYRNWQDFWAEFFRIKHRHSIEGIREWDEKLVTHIIDVLKLEEGDRILDLACGGGDQAIAMAGRGMEVVGVDIATSLVDYGNKRAREKNLSVELIESDMREVEFNDEFDACVILSGSFGFFGEEGDLEVLRVIEKSLKSGGQFYLDNPNPLNRIKKDWKGWDEVNDGYLLMSSDYDSEKSVVMDDFLYITDKGKIIKFKPEDERFSRKTRIYPLNELLELIESANLSFISAYGSFELPPVQYELNSRRMLVVGEKS